VSRLLSNEKQLSTFAYEVQEFEHIYRINALSYPWFDKISNSACDRERYTLNTHLILCSLFGDVA